MSALPKYIVAQEFARRAKQFHPNEEPMKIELWGLFDWGDVSPYIKTGEIIPNEGFTKENRTIWCKPSQAFFDKWIAPLLAPIPAWNSEKEAKKTVATMCDCSPSFPGPVIGGRGKCQYCAEQVDHVAYHEANACKRRPAQRPASLLERTPTQAEINSACLYRNHSFGLMDDDGRKRLAWEAAEWLHAWRKVAEDGHAATAGSRKTKRAKRETKGN